MLLNCQDPPGLCSFRRWPAAALSSERCFKALLPRRTAAAGQKGQSPGGAVCKETPPQPTPGCVQSSSKPSGDIFRSLGRTGRCSPFQPWQVSRCQRPALASYTEQPAEEAFQRPKGTAQGHLATACDQGPRVHPASPWAAPAAGPGELLRKGCSTQQGIAVGKHCAPRPALAAVQGAGRSAGNYLVRSK